MRPTIERVVTFSRRPGPARPAASRRRRPPVLAGALAGVALAAGGAGVAGCSELSEETKQAGVQVACSQIDVDPGEIAENPEQARLVALVVRDLTDGTISQIAAEVAKDPNAANPRAQLAEWVDNECGR